ncbi:hypothetical protein BC943DRAFT_313912 [Umbelopsis sp. AD052]|nr:hypothetical protein BC943DRAFT_313912 [Umbelopsis sp. AD052]
MTTLRNDYVQWQHKNSEALERFAFLESQIASVRKQCEDRRQQELAVIKLKSQLSIYSLKQSEYTSLLHKLNSRTRRTVRDTGLSETTTYTSPDVKASIAIKQLTAKIETLMTEKLKGGNEAEDLSGISVPIMTLLRSSSVDSNMILDQITKYLDNLHGKIHLNTMDTENDTDGEGVFSEKVEELEHLCEEREARVEENVKKEQEYKYQADDLVRQIKAKIATNYPDNEVQRMVLKNILSKAQKQRYHKKVEKLQQASMELEQEQGGINADFPVTVTDTNDQMDQRLQTIGDLHLQIDLLSLKISQQLQRNKDIVNDDDILHWKEIKDQCRLIASNFQKATEASSEAEADHTQLKRTSDTSRTIQEIRRHLHHNMNKDLTSCLREIQALKLEARSKLELEGTINELYTTSKEKQDSLNRELCNLATGEKSKAEDNLASTVEGFAAYAEQKQAGFWQDHHNKLVEHLEGHKEKAIASIQQIQRCIDERDEMLQGELVMDNTHDS